MAVMSAEKQIKDILSASAELLDVMRLGAESSHVVGSRIVTQPLKRSTDTNDLFLMANDPTPQCFDNAAPYWLRPSMSIAVLGSGYTAGSTSEGGSGRYLTLRIMFAYYASSDVADTVLWTMRRAAVEAIHGEVVTMPGGTGIHLRARNDLTPPLPVPEFPGAGKVMLERIGAYGVWRRT